MSCYLFSILLKIDLYSTHTHTSKMYSLMNFKEHQHPHAPCRKGTDYVHHPAGAHYPDLSLAGNHGKNHIAHTHIWLHLPSRMFLRFTHVVVYTCSFSPTVPKVLSVKNKITMSRIQVFLLYLNLLSKCLRVESLAHMGMPIASL